MPGNARKVNVEQAYAMVCEGQKLVVIAAHFGVTHVAIVNALSRAGLPTCAHRHAQREKGEPETHAIQRFDRLEAYAMVRQGLKGREMAAKLGVTREAVGRGLRAAGLPACHRAYRAALEAGTLERDYPGTIQPQEQS